MKIKYLIVVLIVLSGAALSGSFLFFPNLFFYKSAAQISSQWIQETGAGISVPACASASGSGSCSGTQAYITVGWSVPACISAEPYFDGVHYGYQPCTSSISVPVADGSCHSFGVSIDGFGSHTDDTACAPVCASPPPPPPTASISAYPTTIPYNTASTINWSSTNATSCNVSPPGWTGTSGAQSTGNLTSSQTYTVNCSGPGGSVSAGVTVNVSPQPPPVITLTASPNPIDYGQGSTLSWSATNNPTSCTASGSWSGSRPASDSESTGGLTTAQTYTLSCSNSGGSDVKSITVNVLPGSFNLSLGGSVACNSVPLTWTASGGAQAYRILRGAPRVDISPYQPYTFLNFTDTTVSQNTTYQYQIEAYNSAGTNRSNTINVATPYCPPTLSFSGNPTTLFQGQPTTLTWSTTFTTSCTASSAPTQSNWSGSKALNGSQVVVPNPPPSVTYNMQCSGPGGTTAVQSVTMTVIPLALPNWKEIIPR